MRWRLFGLCAVPAVMVLASTRFRSDSGFAFPSCLASLPSGPGGQLHRLVPSEAKEPLGTAGSRRGCPCAHLEPWADHQGLFQIGHARSAGACDPGRSRVDAIRQCRFRFSRKWCHRANARAAKTSRSISSTTRAGGRLPSRISRQRDPSMNLQFFGVDTPRYTNGQQTPELEAVPDLPA